MAKKITTPQAKLNVQHDYISLKLPVGTFTTSFRGSKASGQLCQMKGAFEALDKYVQTTSKKKSIGESMNDLLNPVLLNKLVPGWDKPLVSDTFLVGDNAKFVSGLFSKKYPSKYKVVNTKGKYIYLEITNVKTGKIDNIGFVGTDLEKVK